MKTGIFLLLPVISVFVLLAFRYTETQKTATSFNIIEYKKQNIVRCSPDWNELNDWLDETDIPPIPGAGIHQWNISTSSDSAQFYFNQGMNMYYSFHIIEAMASFKKAAKFDPGCAMLYWAQALAYGPNINDYGYAATYNAYLAAGRAIESCGNCTEKEEKLIWAQRSRYTGDSLENRQQLNEQYTANMREVYQLFPDDPDVAALYADAMMLQHPWDLWYVNGTPKPWTPHIREVLEKLMAKYPDHPGGNHYYIHVMEPSPYAAKAIPAAEKLGKTNPGLSHVVHMPSHIYLRTGYYQKGVDVNIKAVDSYKKTIPLYAAVTGNDFIYIIHNLHMKTNNAMMLGNYKISETSAAETRESVPLDYLSLPAPIGNLAQYIYMTPLFVHIRFGKWDDILKHTKPDDAHIYANILYHFGRGLAFSNKKDFDKAGAELDRMRELMKDTTLTIPMLPFSAVIEGAKVAEQILLGVIHEKRNLYDGAIRHYTMADSIEISMVYNEPRDWLLSPKHYLGNACLVKGDAVKAENVFKKDLQYNSENGWSLFGLQKSLEMQKKTTEAAKVKSRFNKAFSKADIKITSSVY